MFSNEVATGLGRGTVERTVLDRNNNAWEYPLCICWYFALHAQFNVINAVPCTLRSAFVPRPHRGRQRHLRQLPRELHRLRIGGQLHNLRCGPEPQQQHMRCEYALSV